MIFACVTGNVEASHKFIQYEGLKLLIVQPLDINMRKSGDRFLAVDAVGAGRGDIVLVMEEGWSCWQAVGKEKAPINRAIIGIVDTVDLAQKDRARTVAI